jgi:RNA polymerase sigma-70 factor (ECF subfamily)
LEAVASQTQAPPRQGDVREWIRSARNGSAEALGRLLEQYRPYLTVLANQELPAGLRGKAGASDLVQETFLRAQEHFDQFREDDEAALHAWLRHILLDNAANLKRRSCATDKRQVGRELPLADDSAALDVSAPGPSPSSLAVAEEEDAALCRALEQLPEEYRQVVTWRNFDYLPFDEIGRRLDRSAAAARKLWVRAVEHLQQGLGPCDEP